MSTYEARFSAVCAGSEISGRSGVARAGRLPKYWVIQAFAREVTATGAEFRILHLPLPTDLDLRRRLGRWPYQTFLTELDAAYRVVHPEDRLLSEVEESGLSALYKGHFTALGNRIIAEELFRDLVGAQGD